MELVQEEAVDYAVAKAAATNPGDFELKMNMLSGRASTAASGAMSGAYF
jgi:twitching motility protein PilT